MRSSVKNILIALFTLLSSGCGGAAIDSGDSVDTTESDTTEKADSFKAPTVYGPYAPFPGDPGVFQGIAFTSTVEGRGFHFFADVNTTTPCSGSSCVQRI